MNKKFFNLANDTKVGETIKQYRGKPYVIIAFQGGQTALLGMSVSFLKEVEGQGFRALQEVLNPVWGRPYAIVESPLCGNLAIYATGSLGDAPIAENIADPDWRWAAFPRQWLPDVMAKLDNILNSPPPVVEYTVYCTDEK
jgi:hypothetical protein